TCGRYVAVQKIETWSFLGREFYARSTLGVYDSAISVEPYQIVMQTPIPCDAEPIGELSIQIRENGIITSGDDQFNLGESEPAYRKQECLAYILNVLAKSANREHRLYAASQLWVPRPTDLIAE